MSQLAATPEAQTAIDTMAAYEHDLKFPQLTGHDRCDRCAQAAVAQAHIAAGIGNLLFCGHHLRTNRAKLEELGYKLALPADDAKPFTWATHQEPWPNQFRDAASAV